MNTDNFSIDELRSQYSLLQKKLENQQIVTDTLVRNSMRHRQSWSRNYVWFEIFLLLPLCILIAIIIPYTGESSWGPWIAIIPVLLADVYADYKFNILRGDAFMRENLVDTANRMAKYKLYTRYQLMISLPLVVLWCIWLVIDFSNNAPAGIDSGYKTGMIISMSIGGVLGAIIGFIITRKMQRDRQFIIDQIHEMEAGEVSGAEE